MRIRFLITDHMSIDVKSVCERACRHLHEEQLTADVVSYASEDDCFEIADVDAWLQEETVNTLTHRGNAFKNEGNLPAILYVTDSPGILHRLQDRKVPVIALAHEGNRDADWSGAAYIFSEPDEIDVDSYVKAYERLAGIPWTILETTRLLIRETTVEDVDLLYDIYADPSMTQYMEGLFENPEDEKHYMHDYIQNIYGLLGFGVWSVILKETGEIIGRAGFSIRNGFDKPELGFLIGVNRQGQGYAQEALRAILAYGREVLGFETVQALVKEGNDKSVHILQKLGFEIRGPVRAEENIYGDSYTGMGKAGKKEACTCGTFIEMVCVLN